ncbi:MAG: phage/plasmid primase, P4 family [Thermodesulfobacteriota bacterium]|nr:phage/plasmid primase, P4 family [Thermodesulfobacteriota bacterium]
MGSSFDLAEALRKHGKKIRVPGTSLPRKVAGKAPNLTEFGNAERLVAQHGEDVRYCHTWGKWLIWDGIRWKVDVTGEMKRRAKQTVRQIYHEASQQAEEADRKNIAKYAIKSESNTMIKSMLSLAQSEVGIPVTPDEFDADPMLLNCLNGTLDLQRGVLLAHNRDHLITKLAPVEYDPQGTRPMWGDFLTRIMGGNQELISFLQRAIGYCLTGLTTEQALFFLFGTGANGKSTFLEILRCLLGDYAQQTDFETFLVQKYATIRNDLAKLKGARMVSAVEVDSGKRLAEVLVKQITGGDTISARFLHKEFFEFKPEFKVLLAANHKPQIRGTDYAIWRRIRLIPFTVTIPEDEQDKELPTKLKEELPGILAWAVEGCLQWQKDGLKCPADVKAATEQYKDEMDLLRGFLDDKCLLDENLKARARDLYGAYKEWCETNGEDPVAQRTFGMKLSERGLTRKRWGGAHYWFGIGLVTHGTDCTLSEGFSLHEADTSEKDQFEGHNGSHGSHPKNPPKSDTKKRKNGDKPARQTSLF